MLSKEEIEKDTKRCKELIKVEHANWIGISNQLAITHVLEYIDPLETREQKLIEKIKNKIESLDKIAKKKDLIPQTVKEQKLDGSIVYSSRFNADGYIAEAIVNVLQELLDTEFI